MSWSHQVDVSHYFLSLESEHVNVSGTMSVINVMSRYQTKSQFILFWSLSEASLKIIRKSRVDQPIHRQYDKALQTLQSWVQKTILVPTQLGWLRYSGSPVSSETIVWVTQLCFSFTGLWWFHAFKYSPWSGINYATFLLFSFTVQ